MDRLFGNAYRGDPGVPHTDPDHFVNIWIGSFALSALTSAAPHLSSFAHKFNWQDKAMLMEQLHWKNIMKKGEPSMKKKKGEPTMKKQEPNKGKKQ